MLFIHFTAILLALQSIHNSALDNAKSLRSLRTKTTSLIKPNRPELIIEPKVFNEIKPNFNSDRNLLKTKTKPAIAISTPKKAIAYNDDEDDDFIIDTLDEDEEEDTLVDNDYGDIEDFMENLDESATSYVTKKYKKGDKINAKITRFGRIGMSVETFPDRTTGLILQQEVDFLIQSSGGSFDPQIGDTVTGYVLYVRDDGKMDVSLRPIGFNRFQSASDAILATLKASPSKSLDIGDKSSPEMIMSRLPGMSKNMYKAGLSSLLREGVIEISEFEMILVPENQRKPVDAAPYSGKTPRGFKPTDSTTLFVANFPYTTTEEELAAAIEEEIGYGKLAKLKLTIDRVTGRPAGYAYANFFTPEQALEALKKANGIDLEGRKLRLAPNAKSSSSLRTDFKSSSTTNREDGERPMYSRQAENASSEKRMNADKFDTDSSRSSSRNGSPSRDTFLDDEFEFKELNSKNSNTSPTTQKNNIPTDNKVNAKIEESTHGKWRKTASESPYGRRDDKMTKSYKTVVTREGRDSIVKGYQSKYSSQKSSNRGEFNGDSHLNKDAYSCYIGGLPYSATESLVKQTLESSLTNSQGGVNEIRLVRNPSTGESKGYGYVDFANLETAQRAVEQLNGRMILGRNIKLDIEGPKHRPKNY